jgi:hypothetical protein
LIKIVEDSTHLHLLLADTGLGERNQKEGHREDNGGIRRRYQDLAEAQQMASVMLNEYHLYSDIRSRNQVGDSGTCFHLISFPLDSSRLILPCPSYTLNCIFSVRKVEYSRPMFTLNQSTEPSPFSGGGVQINSGG